MDNAVLKEYMNCKYISWDACGIFFVFFIFAHISIHSFVYKSYFRDGFHWRENWFTIFQQRAGKTVVAYEIESVVLQCKMHLISSSWVGIDAQS